MTIEDAPPFGMIEPPSELRAFYGEADGSSYIAPFVDEFGVAHSTAYDSRAQDMLAETMARRFKGQQLFNSLVDGGASREEAFRLAAPDLLFNDTKSLMKSLPKITEPFTPSFRDVEGGRIFQRGPNSAQFLPKKNPLLPPEIAAQRQMVRDELNSLRRAASDPITGRMVDKSRIAALEKQYIDLSRGGDEAAAAPVETARHTVVRSGPRGIEMFREEGAGPSVLNPLTPPADGKSKTLTRAQAIEFVRQAKGDKTKARQLAKEAGYTF